MWTYSGDPSASPLDAVRFLIRDTDRNDQQLQDTEIAWLLSENTDDVYQAALSACTNLSASYTRRANKSVGNLSISYASVSQQYTDLRKALQAESLRRSTAAPYAGGQSLSDMEIDAGNDDLVQPAFSVGGNDNQGSFPNFDRTVP